MQMFRALRRLCACIALSAIAACGGGGDSTAPTTTAAPAAASDDSRKQTLATPSVKDFAANGWFWNPREGGTGFMFEAQGNKGFVAFFMYEEGTGKPLWYAADGALAANADGTFDFAGDLRYYTQGQPVESSTYVVPQSRSIGAVQIRFTGNDAAVQLPGRRIAGTRFDFNGLQGSTSSVQPEVGWYYNPAEGGRGYAIEVQNNKVFMAMFHYNQDGTPTWNVVDGDLSSGVVSSAFQLFSGGQTLGSAYVTPANKFELGRFTLSFRNACAGQVRLAGAPAVSIQRFVFGDLPAGSECRSTDRATADVVPGLVVGPVRMQPGDTVFGRIDVAGDVDVYGISLQAGETYVFGLKGAGSKSGTLADPLLALYDASLTKLSENNNAATGQTDSRLTYTAAVSGIYFLSARANGTGVGSFILSATGVAPELKAQDVLPASAFAGDLTATLVGGTTGRATLAVSASGTLTGSVVLASGATLVASGRVSDGGMVAFVAAGAGTSISFSGFLGPQGSLVGTWAPATGSGGIVTGQSVSAPSQPVKLTVRARGSLAAGVGPTMVVRVNGAVIGTAVVQSTAPADYDFSSASLSPGAKVDVVFTNDAVISGQDRNLFVLYLTDGVTTVMPTAPGSTVDWGAAAQAFDGINVVAGQGDLYSSGALRLAWPSAVSSIGDLARRQSAARLLLQASFGPTPAELDRLDGMTDAAWINEQIALPATNDYVPEVQRLYDLSVNNRPGGSSYDSTTPVRRFWATVNGSPDQLRKRVAFAMHQIFMVSQADSNLYDHTRAYANYLDTLNRHALGNYRNLLEDIALSPVMGIYLSHIRNRKENPATGQLPDENFAREVMQLFTIGLQELNLDGTLKLDANGKPIETYNNADVMGMAKVFTGWSWGFPDSQLTDSNFRFGSPKYTVAADTQIDLLRMKAYPGQHSTSEKVLFAGKASAVTIPANTPAAESLRVALDTLFNHPNVGPFIGRQLIQRLVTGNPSPAYVGRVAASFNNNGQGVRGDLAAVVRTILLDPEARQQPGAGFGKLKEPILRVSNWMRAFGTTSATGNFMMVGDLDGLNQRPYSAPSVFSYFRPGYVPPNSAFSESGATAPEFQLVNESTTPAWVNLAENMAGTGLGWTGTARDIVPSMNGLAALSTAGNIDAILQQLDQLMFAGRMPRAVRQDILDSVTGVSGTDAASHLNRARVAVFVALSSPEFLVQR